MQRLLRYVRLYLGVLALITGCIVLGACRPQSADRTETETGTDSAPSPEQTDGSDTAPDATTERESIRNPETLIFDDGIVEETSASGGEVVRPHYVYSNDFSEAIGDSDPDWYANEAADMSDGTLTSRGSTHFFVAGKHKIKADTATVTLDLQANRPGALPHDSGYIGLRVSSCDDQFAAVGQKGIWLAFQNRSVGIIDTWPRISMISSPVDFSSVRRVTVTDNADTNEIAVYAQADDGTQTMVFRVIITDGRTVSLVNAQGKAEYTTTFSYDIDTTGYVCFWAHQNNGGVVYDNISMEWEEQMDTSYKEADPTGIRDLYSDTWTAVDGAGRTVNGEGAAVKDKLVGMFYEVWHTVTHTTYADQVLYDHNAIYRQGGAAALKDALASGPIAWSHYWAEPYFGYYLATDRWIIRKHASMLTDIGVDFIYLDVTNGEPFTNVYKTLFREFRALREAGVDTPDICFFLSDSAETCVKVFNDIWDNLYATGAYSDLYAMYEGKPLIFGNLSAIDAERREAFTVRRCWALQENIGDGTEYWSWMCETPQVISYNPQTGAVEEMSVSAGILANLSIGRSYTQKGGQPALGTLPDGSKDEFQFNLDSTPLGLLFAEQMQRAAEVDPYVLLVTGWNEWTAGRWETDMQGALIANTYLTGGKDKWTHSYYVDAFNPEFSRDIEPMKGGFGDNYYYQLAAFLRQFRGARNALTAGGQTISDCNADAAQWDSVWPEYRDTEGDTLHRDSLGFGGFFTYTNDTGRNDILRAKVSRSGGSVVFMVECRDELTAPQGSEWMNLFLDADCNAATGWAGYDYVIGRDVQAVQNGKGKVSVHAFRDGAWDRQELIGQADVRVDGRYLFLSVSAELCGLTGDFDFKWADNSVSDGDVMAFLDRGDAAPNGRFNYAYRAGRQTANLSQALADCLDSGVGFAVGKSYMVYGTDIAALVPASTAVTPHLTRGRVFVPVAALNGVQGFSVEMSADGTEATVTRGDVSLAFCAGSDRVARGIDTVIIPVAPYTENGQLYIPLNVVAHYNGMHLLTDRCGGALMTGADTDALTPDEISRLLRELNRVI